MDKFDDQYVLLQNMFEDTYYPQFLVEKIKWQFIHLIEFLEGTDVKEVSLIQDKLDEFTIFINNLQQEFWDQDSEIETVASESIANTLEYILNWFKVDVGIEDALREREW
ncbi:MAG: hypothetical protein IKY40_04825 [Phascolarctobacterium sp.]|nr:hypothetical protein [Phascolarctobacterium sp.]MBR5588930.1 hypothetical protein [Phascolarctobacterium sp.]MBR5791032.1 hypothetical protein [Phascolarctobacterium sp.]